MENLHIKTNRNYIISKLMSFIIHKNQCWIWKRSINSDGYGSWWINGKSWKTHRLSYILFKGEIESGLCVCHSCDERACVNPDHLWVGTHQENMEDMVKKRRTLYAEQRPNNKISSAMRPGILSKYLNGATQMELANEYNCSDSAIWNAIHSLMPDTINGMQGERHPLAKLREKDIYEIRKLIKEGLSSKEIAKKFNMTPQAINNIKKRRSWTPI